MIIDNFVTIRNQMSGDEIRRRADKNKITLWNKSFSGQGQNGDWQFLDPNFRGFKPAKIMESTWKCLAKKNFATKMSLNYNTWQYSSTENNSIICCISLARSVPFLHSVHTTILPGVPTVILILQILQPRTEPVFKTEKCWKESTQ